MVYFGSLHLQIGTCVHQGSVPDLIGIGYEYIYTKGESLRYAYCNDGTTRLYVEDDADT